jgi:hypothetical protein
VRTDGGTMVPLSTLVSSHLNGPQYFERYNVYSGHINGTNAPGYARQAIAAMEELARIATRRLRLRGASHVPGEEDRRPDRIHLCRVMLSSSVLAALTKAGRCR